MLDYAQKFLKLRLRWLVSIALVAFVLFLGLLVYSTYYPFIFRNLLWKDIQIDSFKLSEDGPIYGIKGGVATVNNQNRDLKPEVSPVLAREDDSIIRMVLFTQINNEDPLFGGIGFDVDVFDQAVARLGKNQDDFLKELGLEDDIYPIDFLNKITEVNRLNTDFEQYKSVVSANKLLKKERETVSAYRNYAIFLKEKLSKTKLPAGLFVQTGGITSKDILLSDMQKTIDNASAIDSEITSRSSCLNVSSMFCNRRTLKVFNDYSEITSKTPTEIFPPLPTLSGQPVVAKGPYQIITPCGKLSPTASDVAFFYAIESHNQSDLSSQQADNIYFEKLSVEQFGNDLYNQYLSHGLEWDVATMNNGYTCNDMEYQASVATINSYYKEFGQEPLMKGVVTDGWPEQLRAQAIIADGLEVSFATEKYPSEITLSKLAKSYAEMYNQVIVHENSRGAVSADGLDQLKDKLLCRFNFINNRMADYGRTVSYMAFRTESHSLMSEVNPKGQTELNYIYFMRNDYGLTLGGFSPSVWRSAARLEFLSKDTQVNPKLLGYGDFVKQFGLDYVEKVMSVTRDVVVAELRAKAGL